MMKLSTAVENNTMKFMIWKKDNKTLFAQVHQDVRNESHALEHALSEIEKIAKGFKI